MHVGLESCTWAWSHAHGPGVMHVGLESHTWAWSHTLGSGVTHMGLESPTWVWSQALGHVSKAHPVPRVRMLTVLYLALAWI